MFSPGGVKFKIAVKAPGSFNPTLFFDINSQSACHSVKHEKLQKSKYLQATNHAINPAGIKKILNNENFLYFGINKKN